MLARMWRNWILHMFLVGTRNSKTTHSCYMIHESQSWAFILEKSKLIFTQNVHSTCSHKMPYSQILTAALFVATPNWKQPKGPSTTEG